MALLISDSNIVIDFEEGGILDALFGLQDRIGVPDILFEDELRERHAHLLQLGLVLIELSAPTMARVVELARRYPRPSRLDIAALAAAQQETCPLLTGDRRLRAAAVAEGVEVHGTLWVAERLVTDGVLAVSDLRRAFRRMEACGRRLPWDAVERHLDQLDER